MPYVRRSLPDKYRSAFRKTHLLPSVAPVPPASLSQTPFSPLPLVFFSSPHNSLLLTRPDTEELELVHEEEEGYLRLGWKLSVFTLCTFTYVTLVLVDFYWFVGSVLIVCLTEGTGLVVYSTLVAKWARWYCQGRAGKIAAQRTRRLPEAAARTIRPAHQFDLLRTDTINCLRAIRLRRE